MAKNCEISLDIINHKRTLDLDFRNITYIVNDKCNREKKQLLNNVSGFFQAGRFTGILGPSGAGKSSLLNVLSGFK
jgi:ABC-type multidrug transport system ATPase subunit